MCVEELLLRTYRTRGEGTKCRVFQTHLLNVFLPNAIVLQNVVLVVMQHQDGRSSQRLVDGAFAIVSRAVNRNGVHLQPQAWTRGSKEEEISPPVHAPQTAHGTGLHYETCKVGWFTMNHPHLSRFPWARVLQPRPCCPPCAANPHASHADSPDTPSSLQPPLLCF
jgi:hypothetical protein